MIHQFIDFKFSQWLFLKKSKNFSREIITTPLISGTALVKKIGCFIVLLTKRQKNLIYLQFSLTNYHRTSDECNDIINQWKITFQALDNKERSSLDLLNNDLNIIKPLYSKGGSWLKHFSYSNSLCAKAMRVIINHTPISKYHLRFFPWEDFACPCSLYLIETKRYILYKCKIFSNYWNSRKDTLSHFILFLEFNSNTLLNSLKMMSFIYLFFYLVFLFFSSF